MKKSLRYVSMVLLEAQPAWLALDRKTRNEIMTPLRTILSKYPDVSVRWLDSDAIGHGYTDIALCEYNDIEKYHFLWEELRDTIVFGHPYFLLKDTLFGIEDAYVAFENSKN
ncbi:hypothetical protein CH373_02750 [Leptospira perolatii]|uniref:Darcynin 1 n=1 Tax=Leptospira perolatii TaxID=2023191 RepID=A0A2M9ZS96_9LEPT|nr:darcynin family protein [Leptospira perolatii]PJZ71434.1 hypothetical protein CH360_02750 [Leptospira perolatii]PJZ74968.1 hypothetical protein CH373_02750 [Leptospira perolatii]